MSNKTSDKNVDRIEKDIERCKQLTKPEHANWIGISNQKAIGHLISHYKNMKFNYEKLIHDISLIAESLDMQEDSTIEEIAIRISEEMYNQQQINEEHQKINGELREKVKELEEKNRIFALEGSRVKLELYIKENYIPKQVVKDLIENETIDISGFECIAVEDLQELLEGERK